MKSKINFIKNHSSKNFTKEDIFSKNPKNSKLSKIAYYRNDLSNANYTFWKTYRNINENNRNTKKNINIKSNSNSNTIIESIYLKEKFKLKKRPINSAFLIRKTNTNYYENKSPKLLLKNNNNIYNNNYNIRKIHDIISLIEKKLNLLHKINKDENENYFNYKNKYKYFDRNDSGLTSPINPLTKRNNNRKKMFNFSKTIYKYKNQSSLSAYKENIIINNNENNRNNINIICEKKKKINKNELIPSPYKRLQKKLRKYFSFPKKIDLSEEHFPCNFIYKRLKINNKYRNSRHIKNNDKININYEEKINYKRNKNSENIKKEDKSINTDNSIFGRNLNNLKYNKIKIKSKNMPLFNNELISSRTYRKDIKDKNLFITTYTNKNKKRLIGENQNKKVIYAYYKNN